MNAATVASAVKSTMLIAPMIAVTPNTRPAVIRSVLPAACVSGDDVSVENVSLIFDHTSIAPIVRYRIPMAIIQTKNMTIATMRLIFSTVHGSTRLSCSEANRGGRRGALARRAASEPARAGGAPGTPGRPPTCCGEAIAPSEVPGGAVDTPPGTPVDTPPDVVAPGPDGEVMTSPRPNRGRPNRCRARR